MLNIEYLRQLHRKKLNLKRTRFRLKRVLFLRKGPRFSVRKGLDLHILRSQKEPGLWST